MRQITNKYIIFLSVCFCLSAYPAKDNWNSNNERPDNEDQYQSLIRFAGNIHQFNNIFPQEKVWLQFDNTAYFQGDTIWFKVYATHATTLQRAPSKVVYVELVSPSGFILQTLKLPLIYGQSDGCFELKDKSTYQARMLRGIIDYPSGFYEIRAYTLNMLNFDNSCMFSRVFPVYQNTFNPFSGYESTVLIDQTETKSIRDVVIEKKKSPIIFECYPEGGSMIIGLESNIAYKATDKKGVPLAGYVTIENDDSIYSVTEHDGMGSFRVTPQSTKIKVLFHCESGNAETSVKGIKRNGYSIAVTNKNDSLLSITAIGSKKGDTDSLGMTVTCKGELIHFEPFVISNGKTINLDTYNWPIGVCRITVFNKLGEIIACRSIFHNNDKFAPPTIGVTFDSLNISPYSRIKMQLSLADRYKKPIHDRICIAVRDATDLGNSYQDNILTNLLLSSDIKGYIHNPEYYLESNDSVHRRALDLLMLVQGWERYDWNIMTLNSNFTEMHRIEEGLTLNGWILSKVGKNNKRNIDVRASVIHEGRKNVDLFSYITGKNGYFGFNLTPFFDKAKLNVNLYTTENKAKDARIRFERSIVPKIRVYNGNELLLNTSKNKVSYLIEKDQNDLFNSDSALFNYLDAGIMLEQVDIEARQYVDFDTFSAFDVEKDNDAMLDKGEYSTDVWGYLLNKGYPVHRSSPYDELNQYNVFYYVHDSEKILDQGIFEQALDIDLMDVKSILVYDKPMTFQYLSQLMPLKLKQALNENDTEYFNAISGFGEYYHDGNNDYSANYSSKKVFYYYLIDILIKDDWELSDNINHRKLGKRVSKVVGYSRMVDYYKTEYLDTPEGSLSQDFRRTLFWNPNVITDSMGNAQIEFYNNVYSRHFHISGSGITASGTPYCLDQDF